jgi:hypothetical protein
MIVFAISSRWRINALCHIERDRDINAMEKATIFHVTLSL